MWQEQPINRSTIDNLEQASARGKQKDLMKYAFIVSSGFLLKRDARAFMSAKAEGINFSQTLLDQSLPPISKLCSISFASNNSNCISDILMLVRNFSQISRPCGPSKTTERLKSCRMSRVFQVCVTTTVWLGCASPVFETENNRTWSSIEPVNL